MGALGAKLAWLLRRMKDLRLNMMVEFVKQLVIRVLVRDPDADFDIHMTLTDMGMDSLVVRELSNMLGKQIGKKALRHLGLRLPQRGCDCGLLVVGLEDHGRRRYRGGFGAGANTESRQDRAAY